MSSHECEEELVPYKLQELLRELNLPMKDSLWGAISEVRTGYGARNAALGSPALR
jgi:hypothetical protein